MVLLAARPALSSAVFPVVAGPQTSEAEVARSGGFFPLSNGDRLELVALRDVMASFLAVGACVRSGGRDERSFSEVPGKFSTNFGVQLLHVRRVDLLSLLLDELAQVFKARLAVQLIEVVRGLSGPLEQQLWW